MQAYRASILDFIDNPARSDQAWRYCADGLLLVDDGRVVRCGDYTELAPTLTDSASIDDLGDCLIMPGFIDTHVHYPQTDMIASHGAQLLDWLERYTFPTERRFDDAAVAGDTADFFISELLRNGTTTAMVFATIHPQSVDAVFAAARAREMCLISGKVMMDRNAPDFLCDTPHSGYEASVQLIEKWHHHARLHYAVTPRFAPTSSEEQLRFAQRLVNEVPDVYLQSHVAENHGEVAWVAELFPWSRSYLDVYDHFGLLGDRSVYAHCIHLDRDDRDCMAQSGAAVSFCPTSNLFLGSGLFDMQSALEHDLPVTLGTDVGAGTSFNMLRTMNAAYKVCQMSGFNLSPMQAYYSATLGAARALLLDQRLGNFEPGREADFIVIDLQATPLLERRMQHADSIEDQLFALMMLGDDRNIAATYILGQCRHSRDGL